MRDKITLSRWTTAIAIVAATFGDAYRIAGLFPPYLPFLAVAFVLEIQNILTCRTRTIAEWCAIAWVFFALVSSGIHNDTSSVAALASSLINALFVLLIVSTAKRDEPTEKLYSWALLISIAITISACFVELATGVHYMDFDERYLRMFSGQSAGFQVNINDNATALTLMVPMALLSAPRDWRLAKAAMLVSLIALVVNINSRLCIISILLFFAGLLCLQIEELVLGKELAKRRYLLAFFLVGFFALVVVALNFEAIYEGIISLSGDSLAVASSDDALRVDNMLATIAYALYPGLLIGNGAGSTLVLLNSSPHCALFELLSDFGVVVFVSLMGVLFELLFSYKTSIDSKKGMILTLFPLLFFMVSFCSSSMLRIRLAWVILAIAYCDYTLTKSAPCNSGMAVYAEGEANDAR